MNIYIYILFFVSLTISNCSTQEFTPEKLESIEKLLNDLFIPSNSIPGMCLSIVMNNTAIVLSKGYGKQNIEKNINSTNNTLFSIGSITKSFVSTLVVKTLSEIYPDDGESVLDEPIITFVKDFNFTFSDRFRAEETSFRDLISHRTCLGDQGLELIFGSLKTSQEYNYRTRYQTEVCGHRGGWSYNNALYALAGELIASLHGMTFEQLLKNFMVEIGMLDSTTIDSFASYEDLPNMSQPYYKKDGNTEKYNITLLRRVHIGLGAGGILSTSNDMAKYMSLHLNKGKVGDKQIVSEKAISWMYKPSMSTGALPGKQIDSDVVGGIYAYGLGLQLSLHDGYSVISHSGFWAPYWSEFYLFPSKNIGIFLSTNGPGLLGDSTYTPGYVGAAIFDILNDKPNNPRIPLSIPVLDIEYSIGHLRNAATFIEIQQNYFDLIQNKITTQIQFDDVIGIYGNELAGILTITLDNENNNFIQINYGEWGIGRLIPISSSTTETKYLVEWKTDIVHFYYALQPMPTFHIDFQLIEQNILLFSMDNSFIIFKRNATLETLPVIPWTPDSCGPK